MKSLLGLVMVLIVWLTGYPAQAAQRVEENGQLVWKQTEREKELAKQQEVIVILGRDADKEEDAISHEIRAARDRNDGDTQRELIDKLHKAQKKNREALEAAHEKWRVLQEQLKKEEKRVKRIQ